MPFCKVADDVELYYEDFGEGSPVVFTNAGNLTHKMWMGQVAALAPEFRTVTYDIRGTGLSSKPRGDYTAEAAAADLCALVERLDTGRVTMVAHGIGTHIAIVAADMRPDLVHAMVLVSGAPWFRGERDGISAGVADEFLAFSCRARPTWRSLRRDMRGDDRRLVVPPAAESRRRPFSLRTGVELAAVCAQFFFAGHATSIIGSAYRASPFPHWSLWSR